MTDLRTLAEQLVNLTVKQANELFDILKNEHGIEPAAAAPVVMAADPTATGGEVVPEQTAFDVILKSPGNSKLAVVKRVRELTGLALTEAKAVVDKAPVTLKEKLSKEEAEAMKQKLEEEGAEVELK